jgi:hypothetical protein
VTLKVAPKTVLKLAMICTDTNDMYRRTLKKSTNGSKGKYKQKDAAFGTIFKVIKCFQKSKQKFYIYFPL